MTWIRTMYGDYVNMDHIIAIDVERVENQYQILLHAHDGGLCFPFGNYATLEMVDYMLVTIMSDIQQGKKVITQSGKLGRETNDE